MSLVDRPAALVTGASSGIGAAVAALFARHNFRVFGTSRHAHPGGIGVEMLTLDVRSDDSVQQCVAEVHARAGRIDVLVNNAGVMHEGFAEETTLAEAHAVFETNLFGVERVTNEVLPGMRRHRQGRIINVGSLAGWVGEPGEAYYAASKAGLARYTQALRHETWHLGLDVSLVELGAFTTNVVQGSTVSEHALADYTQARAAARRTFHDALRAGHDPTTAAALILRVARTPRPRFRYTAGGERWLPLLTVLTPQRLTEALLRRSFGLPTRTGHLYRRP